jgi:hypothetical protein
MNKPFDNKTTITSKQLSLQPATGELTDKDSAKTS